MKTHHLVFCLLFGLHCNQFVAQTYNYSKGFEHAPNPEKQTVLIDQIKAEKPVLSPEATKKQKNLLEVQYRERGKMSVHLLESKQLISSGSLFDYVNGIFERIVTANPDIPAHSRMFLLNDATTNAFTMGNDIIFVYTGLIYTMQNSDELAFVLAHELAHNSFDHVDQTIMRNVEHMTDEELNAQIEKASRQQYQNVSALNDLLLPKLLNEKEMSRKHEIEADSLGVVYLQRAGFSIYKSIGSFDRLQALEDFTSEPDIDLKVLFSLPETSTLSKKATTYRTGNSLGIFSDTNEYTSYLRSHPYGKERKKVAEMAFHIKDSLKHSADTVYHSYRYLANGEMVMYSIESGNLSKAFFYGAQMKHTYPQDEFAQLQLAFVSGELSFLKKQRKSGKYIDLQSNRQDKTYDKTVFFLQSLSPTECQELSEHFMNGITPQENTVSDLVTRTIWAFNKEAYDEYVDRHEIALGFAQETAYEFYLGDIQEYFVRSGKARTVNNK